MSRFLGGLGQNLTLPGPQAKPPDQRLKAKLPVSETRPPDKTPAKHGLLQNRKKAGATVGPTPLSGDPLRAKAGGAETLKKPALSFSEGTLPSASNEGSAALSHALADYETSKAQMERAGSVYRKLLLKAASNPVTLHRQVSALKKSVPQREVVGKKAAVLNKMAARVRAAKEQLEMRAEMAEKLNDTPLPISLKEAKAHGVTPKTKEEVEARIAFGEKVAEDFKKAQFNLAKELRLQDMAYNALRKEMGVWNQAQDPRGELSTQLKKAEFILKQSIENLNKKKAAVVVAQELEKGQSTANSGKNWAIPAGNIE